MGVIDYDLPESFIAQTPLPDRAASRLLHLNRSTGEVRHLQFRDVVEILQPGDLLVRNNTKVTALRIFGNRVTGAAVELLLLREVEQDVYDCLAKPARRLKPGTEIEFEGRLFGTMLDWEDGPLRRVHFVANEPVSKVLNEIGLAPIPPYVKTPLADRARYQTVYAQVGGSAAAPTAGLHFTTEILEILTVKGVSIAEVTLDVGLDTFRPIETDPVHHQIHGEVCSVPPETAKAVAECKGRIIAVGTTTTRTLESFAAGKRQLGTGSMNSKLFIQPGYPFKIIDGMFTNFHMPRTTMLLMLAALAGKAEVEYAYQEALANHYRFLSFGDSMLIL